jgi:hypothetical protein
LPLTKKALPELFGKAVNFTHGESQRRGVLLAWDIDAKFGRVVIAEVSADDLELTPQQWLADWSEVIGLSVDQLSWQPEPLPWADGQR